MNSFSGRFIMDKLLINEWVFEKRKDHDLYANGLLD